MADERNINDINDELVNNTNELLELHHELNDVIKEEMSNEENIKNTINAINDGLDAVIDKKTTINDINNDINNSELDIKNNIDGQNTTLSNIVDSRKDELANVQQTVLEQQKLYGFTTQVLANIQNALVAQQQLNAAISAGSTSASPTPPTSGSATPTPPTSGGTSSTNSSTNSQIDDDVAKKWYSKGNLAKTAFQGSIDLFKKYGKIAVDKWVEIDRHVYTTGRQMGMTTTQMRGLQKNILENYGEMANRLGMTFEEIFKFQESYTQSVGRSVVLTNKQVESFAGLSKIMGETAVNEMAKNMDEFGASSQTAIDYLTLGMARAANQGLNIKDTSEKFSKNIKMASRFTFSKGVDGISKMTLLSQRLKFNMESIGGAIDKFSSIEGAISSAANLQVLGGSYASNFSNPLQAMGEALLDAEGFTQRIVDTVSKSAVFNRETGMVEMSPIDKAKMREASKTLGIDYNELWNMASQQAKMRNIESKIGGKGFTEEQKTFLANTAQYDAKTGAWTVTKMNEQGKQEQVNIEDLSIDTLAEIQQQNDVEKSIQGDVHSIRNKLETYLGNTIDETKTIEEAYKGQKERLAITIANAIDPAMVEVKSLLKTMSMGTFALVGIAGGILNFLTSNSLGSVGDILKDKLNGKGGSSILKHGWKRGIKRAGLKIFGKGGAKSAIIGGTKALGKSIPIIGTLASIGIGGYEAVKAVSAHKDDVNRIKEDSNLSEEEKREAIHESKKDRNGAVGSAVGGTVGGVLGGVAAGAAMGSVVPVVGNIIGGVVGGIAGWWLGEKAGKAIGKGVTSDNNEINITPSKTSQTTNATSKVTTENNNSNVTNSNNATSQVSSETSNITSASNMVLNNSDVNSELDNRNKLLSTIQEDVRKIRLDTISNENRFNYTNSITPKNQYDNKTFIREITTTQQYNQNYMKPRVEKIDLNISGTLKVQSMGKTQNIDMNEIFQSQEFQRMLLNKINEGFSRNGNVVQTRSLDSTQAIMGGYYTPNHLNSKN